MEICMEGQILFSGKNKKYIMILSPAKLVQCMVKVKQKIRTHDILLHLLVFARK